MAQSPEFQRHALLYEALIAFNQFFKTAVEEGAIKEQENEVQKAERDNGLSVAGEQAETAETAQV